VPQVGVRRPFNEFELAHHDGGSQAAAGAAIGRRAEASGPKTPGGATARDRAPRRPTSAIRR